MNTPVLPNIEHLRGKVTDEQLEAINDVLDRSQEGFSRHKADIGLNFKTFSCLKAIIFFPNYGHNCFPNFFPIYSIYYFN